MTDQSRPFSNPSVTQSSSESDRTENLDEKIREKENFDIRSPDKVGEVQQKLPEDEFQPEAGNDATPDSPPNTMAEEDISTEVGINYGLKSPPQ